VSIFERADTNSISQHPDPTRGRARHAIMHAGELSSVSSGNLAVREKGRAPPGMVWEG
jgi:hypothetical protein